MLENRVCVTKVARLSFVINHKTGSFHFILYDFKSTVFGWSRHPSRFGNISTQLFVDVPMLLALPHFLLV